MTDTYQVTIIFKKVTICMLTKKERDSPGLYLLVLVPDWSRGKEACLLYGWSDFCLAPPTYGAGVTM